MVKLYVEGGGDSSSLKSELRKGLSQFLTKAGINNKPRIVACGSRRNAYDSYVIAVENGEEALLLVDSECAINGQYESGENWNPWAHLKEREGDKWTKPNGVEDICCHLMVECMENWFLADKATLKSFFGKGFDEKKLSNVSQDVEKVSKARVYDLLKLSSKKSSKGEYGKGAHSFKLLGLVDPNKVIRSSKWAARFINKLKSY